MKLYDLIKRLLEENEDFRSDDRKLIWKVWEPDGFARSYILKNDFMTFTSTKTIIRTRQKVQQDYPELKPSKKGTRVKR